MWDYSQERSLHCFCPAFFFFFLRKTEQWFSATSQGRLLHTLIALSIWVAHSHLHTIQRRLSIAGYLLQSPTCQYLHGSLWEQNICHWKAEQGLVFCHWILAAVCFKGPPPIGSRTTCIICWTTAEILGPNYVIYYSWLYLEVRCVLEFLTTQACRDWVQIGTTACEVWGLKSSTQVIALPWKHSWEFLFAPLGKLMCSEGCKCAPLMG